MNRPLNHAFNAAFWPVPLLAPRRSRQSLGLTSNHQSPPVLRRHNQLCINFTQAAVMGRMKSAPPKILTCKSQRRACAMLPLTVLWYHQRSQSNIKSGCESTISSQRSAISHQLSAHSGHRSYRKKLCKNILESGLVKVLPFPFFSSSLLPLGG